MKEKFFAALAAFFGKPQVKAASVTAAIVVAAAMFFLGLAFWTNGTLIVLGCLFVAFLILGLYISLLEHYED